MRLWIFAILCAVLLGCSKPLDIVEYEDYTITGVVTDCINGSPVANAQISLVVKHLTNGGFFNSSKPGGDTYTDNAGKYSIRPIKIDGGATDIELSLTKDGYFSEGVDIDPTNFSQSHTRVVTYDFGLGRPGYLKVILNDIMVPDTGDLIKIMSPHSSALCGSYGGDFVRSNPAPEPDLANNYDLKGILHNGVIVFEMNGNDSAWFDYKVRRHNLYDSVQHVALYCPVQDTTEYHLDY